MQDNEARAVALEAKIAEDYQRLQELQAAAEEVRQSLRRRRLEVKALRGGRRKPRKLSDLDPVIQAGYENVRRMRELFSRRRRLTQWQVACELGINSGTASWGMKALLRDGVVAPTGVKVGHSPEYVYVPKAKRQPRVKEAA